VLLLEHGVLLLQLPQELLLLLVLLLLLLQGHAAA
jgi:hypothetical protein